MKCFKCGNEIADNSKFCVFCGSPVAAAPAEPQAPIEAESAPAVQTNPQTPAEPQAPVAPVEPQTPVAPVEPQAPVAPVEPQVPVAPAAPQAPVAPVGSESGSAPAVQTNPVNAAAAAPVPPVQPAQPAYSPIPQDKPKKKGKGGLIAAIIGVCVLLIGGGVAAFFLLFNSPMSKIEKAIEAEDMKTVVELYADVKSEEDQAEIQDKLLTYTAELEKKYMDSEMEYDDIMETLELLQKDVLSDSDELAEIIDNIEVVEDSRDNFAKAEELASSDDWKQWAEAIAYYEQVDSMDEANYDAVDGKVEDLEDKIVDKVLAEADALADSGDYNGAIALLNDASSVYAADDFSDKADEIASMSTDAAIEKAVSEANTAILAGEYATARQIVKEAEAQYGSDSRLNAVLQSIPVDNTITGTWALAYDMHPYIMQEVGEDEFADFQSELIVNFYFEFKEDGTCRFYANEDEIYASMDAWLDDFIDFAIEYMYTSFEDMGISRSQADELIEEEYGMSLEEYFRTALEEELGEDAMGEIAESLETNGYYMVEGDKLYLSDYSNDFSSYDLFTIEGDVLTISAADASDLEEILPGLGYPFTLTRVNAGTTTDITFTE